MRVVRKIKSKVQKKPLKCGISCCKIIHKSETYFIPPELDLFLKDIRNIAIRKLVEQEYYIHPDIALEMKRAKTSKEARLIRRKLISEKYRNITSRRLYSCLWGINLLEV